VDPREPFIEYKWVDVGMLDYDAASQLYLVQKVNKQGRVIDDDGKTVVNGGVGEDGMKWPTFLCSYVRFILQGRRRRYGRYSHGRTDNPTDNVWPKLTRSPAVAEMVGQKLAVTSYFQNVQTVLNLFSWLDSQ